MNTHPASVRKVMIPGSFDPLTHGHVHLIQRVARCFDEVVVAVAQDTTGKSTFWSFEQRLAWVKHVFKDQTGINVKGFQGLLADFYVREQVHAIVRGVRGFKDFDYEQQLAQVNQMIHPTVETIFFPAGQAYGNLSSSMVREIFALGGSIQNYVPAVVYEGYRSLKSSSI